MSNKKQFEDFTDEELKQYEEWLKQKNEELQIENNNCPECGSPNTYIPPLKEKD